MTRVVPCIRSISQTLAGRASVQVLRPEGKRSVAKHNATIRLANIRYAMLEHLKKPPVGFERAVKAHFFYKKDELRAQCDGGWSVDVRQVSVVGQLRSACCCGRSPTFHAHRWFCACSRILYT